MDLVENNPNYRQISFDEVREFSKNRKCLCMETSAMRGINVSEMFETIIRCVIQTWNENNINRKRKKSDPILKKRKNPNKRNACCK